MSTAKWQVNEEKIKKQMRVARYVFYRETLIDYDKNFWNFAGSFLEIGLISLLNSNYFDAADSLFLIGFSGASSV